MELLNRISWTVLYSIIIELKLIIRRFATWWRSTSLKLCFLALLATQVRKIFSPERAKGQIIGDGLNAPEEAAELLINKLVEKDLLFL